MSALSCHVLCYWSILSICAIKLISGVTVYSERKIVATEFEKFDWAVTAVTVMERVTSIALFKKDPSQPGGQMKIMSYSLEQQTEREYYNGYSARNVVIQVNDKQLEKYSDPNLARNAITVSVIFHFVNPKLSDSGIYSCKVTVNRIDSLLETSNHADVNVTIKQPQSSNMVKLALPGRIGFPLELPCSLMAEQERQDSFTAVFWRKGPFLSSSKLITRWVKYRVSADFGESHKDESSFFSRLSFRSGSSQAIFETTYDATLALSAVVKEDFDNWWCEVEFNQDDAVVVYKISVVPDTAPTKNNSSFSGNNNKASLFDDLGVIFDPPYLYYTLGTLGALVLVIIITCAFIYCVLVPVHNRKRKRRRRGSSKRDTQMYPVAHRMSHISIVPCEICQENAIDCFAMPCGHTYCDECLDRLIGSTTICFFCKRPIHKKQKLYNKIQENEYL